MLSVHQFSEHGMVNPVRGKLDHSSKWYGCMLQFGSRPRLLEHLLEKSLVCRQYFLDHVADLPGKISHIWRQSIVMLASIMLDLESGGTVELLHAPDGAVLIPC